MLKLTQKTKIFLAVAAVDFRKGIDRLCEVCKSSFGHNPRSQSMFVFRNKKKTAVKILYYDGTGYWLCMKRLSKGQFWWPKNTGGKISSIDSKGLIDMLFEEPLEKYGSLNWHKVGNLT